MHFIIVSTTDYNFEFFEGKKWINNFAGKIIKNRGVIHEYPSLLSCLILVKWKVWGGVRISSG